MSKETGKIITLMEAALRDAPFERVKQMLLTAIQ